MIDFKMIVGIYIFISLLVMARGYCYCKYPLNYDYTTSTKFPFSLITDENQVKKDWKIVQFIYGKYKMAIGIINLILIIVESLLLTSFSILDLSGDTATDAGWFYIIFFLQLYVLHLIIKKIVQREFENYDPNNFANDLDERAIRIDALQDEINKEKNKLDDLGSVEVSDLSYQKERYEKLIQLYKLAYKDIEETNKICDELYDNFAYYNKTNDEYHTQEVQSSLSHKSHNSLKDPHKEAQVVIDAAYDKQQAKDELFTNKEKMFNLYDQYKNDIASIETFCKDYHIKQSTDTYYIQNKQILRTINHSFLESRNDMPVLSDLLKEIRINLLTDLLDYYKKINKIIYQS